MTNLNSGLLFQRKYESDSNAVRRFLLANAARTITDYKQLCDNSASRDAFMRLVIKAQTPRYWAENSWLNRSAWNKSITEESHTGAMGHTNRQCPICAAKVFHTHLYGYRWVKRCPLHGVDLTEFCPECGKPWPTYNRFIRNSCPTCGTARPMTHERRRQQLQAHTRNEVSRLGLFWSFTKLNRHFGRVLYSDYIGHGWGEGVLTGSTEFPELAVTLFPEHAQIFELVGTSASDTFKELRFTGSPLSTEALKAMPLTRRVPDSFVTDAIRDLDHEIRSAINLVSNHEVSPHSSIYVYVDRIDDYNIGEIAYNAWRSIVDKPFDISTSSTWWMRIFEILDIPQPEAPDLVNLVVSNDRTCVIDPSNDFRAWMYKNHLKNLFIYIYKHAYLLKALLSGYDPTNFCGFRVNSGLLWSHSYNLFRVRLFSQHELLVVYHPFPSWAEILKIPERINEFDPHPKGYNWPFDSDTASWRNTFGRYLIFCRANNLYDCIHDIPVYDSSKWDRPINRTGIDLRWLQ